MKIRKALIQWKNRLTREEILVLGDSHVNVFNHKLFNAHFRECFFNVIAVTGATVSGLKNPNPKTQALSIFLKSIKRSKAKTVIVMLGEVDVGFVIWYRAEKHKAQVSEMLQQALDNYQNLLLTLAKERKVICVSTPYPTIQDGQNWGEIANFRKDVKASMAQRTELTARFNKTMQAFCLENNIAYLSLDSDTLNEAGSLDARFLNTDPLDHHYDADQYAQLIIDRLKNGNETLLRP